MSDDTSTPEPLTTPIEPPPGVTPLLWREFADDYQNTQRDALSHVFANPAYWRVSPVVREDTLKWRVFAKENELLTKTMAAGIPGVLKGTGSCVFDSPMDAMDACELVEIALGGAENAPRPPVENPDDSAPMATDHHGFAPTRQIKARWSRNGGALYLYRVWAKPEDPSFTQERKLEGEEFEAALPAFLRQKLVQTLVATIVRPEGWIVPMELEGAAIGCMRLECSVHFAECVGLYWEKPAHWLARQKALANAKPDEIHNPNWQTLEAPTHDFIVSIVGEHLVHQRDEFDKKLAGKSIPQLQREIVKTAQSMGLTVEAPPAEEEGGHILPMTLENMQAEGRDLTGGDLK